MNILGVSAFYHDSAACLIQNGEIISAALEERFSRKKHDSSFPENAINFCLKNSQISWKDIDYIGFYELPILKFKRIIDTYKSVGDKGKEQFELAQKKWTTKKLNVRNYFPYVKKSKIICIEHHLSHASSAFFPSPFKEAAIITIDGVGEYATTGIYKGNGNKIVPIKQIFFPHSLGLLYSAFTYYTGFKVNNGEYKLMGLSPYGKPNFVDTIENELIDVKYDGSFRLNMKYFSFMEKDQMINEKFEELLGGPRRKTDDPINERHMDIAKSIQVVLEKIILKIASHAKEITDSSNLCISGGVGLNCVANGTLLRNKIFDDIWVQPASSDAGGSLGVAMYIWYQYLQNKRDDFNDKMKGCLLGPEYNDGEIIHFLDAFNANYKKYSYNEIIKKTANLIKEKKIIGWFQGKMEYGPRALGNRSILADARDPEMQKKVNLKIKYRESFRPFAPSVLFENTNDYFETNQASPYMLFTAYIKPEIRKKLNKEQEKIKGFDLLKISRSKLPSITHVDYSSRIQTVKRESNPKYYDLIKAYKEKTGYGVILNTSFNIRNEPIVCNPEDAFKCFMKTEMDYLVIGNYILNKKEQNDIIAELLEK